MRATSRRSTRTRPAVIGILLAVALTLGAITPSTAAENPEPPPLSAEEALAVDALEMAKIESIEVDEALDRLRQQHEAGLLLDEIASVAGDRLAGVWIDQEPRWKVQVRLTQGPRVDSVEALVTSTELPTELSYRPGPSERQLIAHANSLVRTWAHGRQGVSGVAVDPRTAELVVITEDGAGSPSALRASMPPSTPAAVRFERKSAPEVPTYRGGVALETCTAGFGVRNAAGLSGLVYAGHCSGTTKYATTPTGTATYGLTVRGYGWNSNGDLRWASLNSHGATNTFYGASATTPTTRVGTGTAYVGQLLCHRGKASGYSCGYVVSTAYAPSYSCNGSPCNAVFVRVEDYSLANLKGDSGGPWFSGGYAYGVHSGGVVGEVGANGVFTPISRLAAMGVSLL